jgi:hypothetical protein
MQRGRGSRLGIAVRIGVTFGRRLQQCRTPGLGRLTSTRAQATQGHVTPILCQDALRRTGLVHGDPAERWWAGTTPDGRIAAVDGR